LFLTGGTRHTVKQTGIEKNTEVAYMEVEMIFKIAAVGILVAVLNQLLIRAGREEQGLMVVLAGLIVVMMLVVQEISEMFELIRTTFGF
jgi:stage III sporulation protein AC